MPWGPDPRPSVGPMDPVLLVETAGMVTIQDDRLTVRFDRRSHNPILREAELDRNSLPISWLGQRKIAFAFG